MILGPTVRRKLLIALAAGLLPAVGCVTTNQFKDFVRSEIALIVTQMISDPIEDDLADLAGPQVVEEVVPSI